MKRIKILIISLLGLFLTISPLIPTNTVYAENLSIGGQSVDTNNVKAIYNFMHNGYGVSGEGVAAIIGNWVQESSVNPKAMEGNFTDYSEKKMRAWKNQPAPRNGTGLGQWTASRHDSLMKWADKKNKGKWWDMNTQLDYMFNGDGENSNILKKFVTSLSGNVGNDAVKFQSMWERTQDGSIPTRKANAEKIWQYMKKNGMDGKADKKKMEKINTGAKVDIGDSDSEDYDGEGGDDYKAGTPKDWVPFDQVNYQEQGNQTGVQNKADLVSDDAIIKMDVFIQEHKALVITLQLMFTLVIILVITFAIMCQYVLMPGVPGYKIYEKIFNFQLDYGNRKLVWGTAFTVIFLLAFVWSNLYLYSMAWIVKLISVGIEILHLA